MHAAHDDGETVVQFLAEDLRVRLAFGIIVDVGVIALDRCQLY
jgi:hypothetical protein